jgi:hypothetical protein
MLEKVPIQRCNFQLGLYAVHLATGHAISCRAVKAKTIEKYLRNVSAFCARSNPRDPRKSEQTNKALAPAIQGVLDEVKRWENIPERREPFTIEMLRYLIELRDSLPHIHGQDSCLAAMVDWTTDGSYDGFRLSEWAQPNGHHALHNPQLNFKGGIQAFCIEDVEFFTYEKVRVPTAEIIHLSPNDPLVGRDMW